MSRHYVTPALRARDAEALRRLLEDGWGEIARFRNHDEEIQSVLSERQKGPEPCATS